MYLIGVGVYWIATALGRRYVEILINSTAIAVEESAAQASVLSAPRQTVNTIWQMAAGDVAEFRAFQDSGAGGGVNISTLGNTSPEAWIWRIGNA